MKRVALAVLFVLLASAHAAFACDKSFEKVPAEIESRFPENPHSTIYDCVRPFFDDRQTEYEDAPLQHQAAFLYVLVKLTPRMTSYAHRLDYQELLQDAAFKYLALCREHASTNRKLPQTRCQQALDAWGRATLLRDDFSVLEEYAQYATEGGTAYFNKDAVKTWEDALRCRADDTCAAKDYGCVAKGQCGKNEKLPIWFANAEGLGQCRAFASFLARAITEPRLGVTQPKKALFERLCPPS